MDPQLSSFKSKGGMRRIFNACRYSWQGLCAAFKHEAAFRQELLIVLVLVPVAVWIGRNTGEILLLVGSLFFVLIIELINSALEALADAITIEHHPLLGRAKDLGSAAVMLAMIFCGMVWLGIMASHQNWLP